MTEIFWLDKDSHLPRGSRICCRCRHWTMGARGRRCAAFPDGIPDEIWLGENDHTRPYPGDRGIRFEKVTDEEIAALRERVARRKAARGEA